MVTCRSGHENSEGSKFCGQCGGAIVGPPPTCANGHENPDGAKFCGVCGDRITAAGVVASPYPAARNPSESELRRVHGLQDWDAVTDEVGTKAEAVAAPAPGWHPDPSGKPGQRYWDGQGWHQDSPATNPPTLASTPFDRVRPHAEKARRFWSGLSGARKVIVAIAALLIVVGVPVAGCNYVFGASEPDPNSPQAACDAMHDLTNASATRWYQGRKAAGDSFNQIESILTQASMKCPGTINPLMPTIAGQMGQDSVSSLLPPTPGGG